MLLVMGVALYTSRVILSALGFVDFGIFNVIAGMTTMFAFFQSSLSNVTQRFLNYEYGRNDLQGASKIFNISALIYFFLSILVLVVGEIVGLWLIYHKLNIPPERFTASLWVFQATIISLFITINGIVFHSTLIARENMKMYAYIGLFEAFGRLGIAFLITTATMDKLIVYSVLFLMLSASTQIFCAIYCKRLYRESEYKFIWDKKIFYEMFKFAGWNGVGTAVFAINFQGINILLNIFFGPVVNAAKAISSQVDSAVNNFTMNFYTAVRPQIIKSYAAGNYRYFIELIFSSSRYACFLMLLLCIPICFRIEYILTIWLKDIPEYSAVFIIWVLIYSLINTLTNPFWTAIQAVGKLKKYCLIGGTVFLSAFPFSYALLKIYPNPIIVFQVLAVVRLVYVFVVVYIVRQYIDFSIRSYIKDVLFPVLLVAVVSISCSYVVNRIIPDSFIGFLLACTSLGFISIATIYLIGITHEERIFLREKIKSMLC